MPLQNRVDPFGNIVANSSRGLLMGNRGCLHDENRQLGRRRWTTQSWVTCTLSFDGHKRELMAQGHYTELFFLDEVTALAAGHRPCWECRREKYNAFMSAWKRGHELPEDVTLTVKDVDKIMHRDRQVAISGREPFEHGSLPDGVMVCDDGERPWLKWRAAFYPWSFNGYGHAQERPSGLLTFITPASTLRVLEAGYAAEVHPSLRPEV